ncbi:unnamed protein product [Vicia faba]|uniref:Uncharacterized protein n=1 Tax=Vicia faba TaxID=3906 RepID=A0AAV0ZFJ7_VICFA|nr:unnamed protein product [Vicia faba]
MVLMKIARPPMPLRRKHHVTPSTAQLFHSRRQITLLRPHCMNMCAWSPNHKDNPRRSSSQFSATRLPSIFFCQPASALISKTTTVFQFHIIRSQICNRCKACDRQTQLRHHLRLPLQSPPTTVHVWDFRTIEVLFHLYSSHFYTCGLLVIFVLIWVEVLF